MRSWPWAVAGAAVLGLALPASAAIDELVLVSLSSTAVSGNGASTHPAVAGNGSHVAFQTEASNLVAGGGAGTAIALRDMANGTTSLVSRASGAAGPGADDDSLAPSISADGRYVAFESNADNLSAEDQNNVRNIFVRDLIAGTTTLVSRLSGVGGEGSDGHSYAPSISADGRHVAFHSAADNLSTIDDNNAMDIFVRDLQTGETLLVSRAPGLDGVSGNGNSYAPSISADGRHVAFHSAADNLSSEDSNIVLNVFVRDVKSGLTTLVSRADGQGGSGADGDATQAAISGDGDVVAFASAARNLSLDDADGVDDIFVRSLASSTTRLVSRAGGADGPAGDHDSFGPSVSGDGRYVAFQSAADNLSAFDARHVTDIFLRDRLTDATSLMSRASGANGVGGDDTSAQASVSFDGRFVAFDSLADNLAAGQGAHADVFARDVLGPPPEPPAPGPTGGSPGASPASAASGLLPGGVSPRTRSRRSTKAAPKRCAGRVATIVGTNGRDALRGTQGADVISAGGGGDVVRGLGGDDVICLGAGNDRALGGKGADLIVGGPGVDRILGQRGPDRLDGGPGADRMNGGPGHDSVLGRRGSDRAVGGRGSDSLIGHQGDDRLMGGAGADLLRGGTGRDVIFGGQDDDRLYGWTGNDMLGGGTGRDLAVGGGGRDRCRDALRRGCER